MGHSSGILCNASASSRWNTAHGLLVISSQPWPHAVHIIPSRPAALSCFCTRFTAWIFLPRLWTPCTLGSQAPCNCAFLGSILLPPLHYYPKVRSRFPCPNPCLWPSLNLKSLFNIIINREKLFYLNFLQVILSLPVLSLFCWGLNFWNTNQKVFQLTSMPILTTHTSSWWRKRRPSHLQIWEKRKGKNKEKKIRYFGEFTGSPVVRTLC